MKATRDMRRAAAAKLRAKDRQRTSATVAKFAKECNRADTIGTVLIRVAKDGGVDLVRRGQARHLFAALQAVIEVVAAELDRDANNGMPSAEAP